MRTARLVGLSQDGMSLIVATDRGEEVAIPVDETLRAALRGDRPRLGQLEIEMDSSLTPRDIQTRIRAGSSLEDVARVAGMPLDRVERFAAPVLAEREHVAAQAMSASVRRRGETSGHRSLRITVTERLLGRGVDIDTINWDSYRTEDGRWLVTADYLSGESARHARFLFDPKARFSVAENDEGRWLLGEQTSAKGPQPGRRRPELGGMDADTEPTLDLADELALVRATQEPQPTETDDAEPDAEPTGSDASAEANEPTVAVPRMLRSVAPLPSSPQSSVQDPVSADEAALEEPEPAAPPSAMDTLNDLMDNGEVSEHQIYAGLSDASAVPETDPSGGWEPAIVVNFPVEPSLVDDGEESGPIETRAHAGVHPFDDPDLPGTDEPGPPDPIVNLAARLEEADELEAEHAAEQQSPGVPAEAVADGNPDESAEKEPAAAAQARPAPKPARRKRASVPSWDEIMFGGPKRP